MKPPVIDNFKGQYRFLSNFWREGAISNEHRFQAGKTFDEDEQAQIMAAATPAEAKKLGGPDGIIKELRHDWDQVKGVVMLAGLREKFADPELQKLLLSTGFSYLIEGNTWCDQEWGDCRCPVHLGTPGQNKLGRALMHVREEYRVEQRFRKDLKNSGVQAWRMRGVAYGDAFAARMYHDHPDRSEDARVAYKWAEEQFVHLGRDVIEEEEAVAGYGG